MATTTDTNITSMRVAISGVEEQASQLIFSLVSELNNQGYSADATSLQAILTSLQALIPTIKADVFTAST